MPDGNVVSFPGIGSAFGAPPRSEEQISFGYTKDGRGKIAFVDVEGLAEEPLLRILASNGVTALLDLRPCPVFEKPRFRHKDVVFYLRDRNIKYVEFSLLVDWASAKAGFSALLTSSVYAAVEPALASGLSICLYDGKAKEMGWLDEMRSVLRHSRTYSAELHPRSLAGI